MIRNIKGAIFDMDGTLIDSLFLWGVILDEFGKKYLNGNEFIINEEDDKKIRTMTLKDVAYYLHEKYNLASSGDELLDTINEIVADFYSNKVNLKEGVMEFLESCYQNNVKMCIASATDVKLLNLAIDHCNIRKYFSDILSCADLGIGKDKPDIYLKALECLGTNIDDTYVFEDAYVAIKTATDLGIKTVAIYDKLNYNYDEIKKIATICINDGESLKKLI